MYSQNEMAAVKTELMVKALETLIRNMPLSEYVAIDYIAYSLGTSREVIQDMRDGDIDDEQAGMLVSIAEKYGLKIWRHNFIPTQIVCNRTLDRYYIHDHRKAKVDRMFQYWDESLSPQASR